VEKVEQYSGDCIHFCNKVWVTLGASDGQALFFLNFYKKMAAERSASLVPMQL
jgi:hypothetical protein